MQDLARLRLQRIAAEMVVLFLHLAESRQDAAHVIGSFRVAHAVLQVFQFVVQIAHAPAAGDRLIEYGAARHLFHILTEVADRQLLRHRDITFVGRLLAHHHSKESRLAGAVWTDQAHLLAWVQLKGSVNEYQLLTVSLVDAGERDHRNNQASRSELPDRWRMPGSRSSSPSCSIR